MVLGLFVKSEQLWDIIPAIANHSAAIANHSAAIANYSAAIANHSTEINQHSKKIQVLESYHGKLNCM